MLISSSDAKDVRPSFPTTVTFVRIFHETNSLPQIATAINLPALAVECERACVQVEKAISRETLKAQSNFKAESERD